MKSLSFLLAVAVVGVWAEDLSDLLPDPSWARPVVTRQQQVADDNPCTALYSCKDCNTARVCKPTSANNVFVQVSELPCPPSRPYCDPNSGSCVQNAPGNCGGPDKFICMQNGRFPDTSCTKFHVCINYEAKSFECAAHGYTYNPEKQMCEASANCGTFDCSSNTVSKVAHNLSPKYFAYCDDKANAALVVDTCPPQFRMDPDSQLCVPDCQVAGIIPDPEDCHSYYKCSIVHVRRDIQYPTYEKLQCPKGQAYSPTEFLCIDQAKVDRCNKQ